MHDVLAEALQPHKFGIKFRRVGFGHLCRSPYPTRHRCRRFVDDCKAFGERCPSQTSVLRLTLRPDVQPNC
jgi:hypothetical protein